jgi:hypothetical protein
MGIFYPIGHVHLDHVSHKSCFIQIIAVELGLGVAGLDHMSVYMTGLDM